jgi:hypothetical protein
MAYKSLQKIEAKFTKLANETNETRKKRLKNKQQAIRKFN